MEPGIGRAVLDADGDRAMHARGGRQPMVTIPAARRGRAGATTASTEGGSVLAGARLATSNSHLHTSTSPVTTMMSRTAATEDDGGRGGDGPYLGFF